MSRCIDLFEGAIHSEATLKQYRYNLDKFLKFVKVRNYDELLALEDQVLQMKLEDYLFYLRKTVSPNSIPTTFAPLELFFSMNDRNTLNFKKIRKMFPQTIKKSGNGYYSTEDVKNMLKNCSGKRSRAIILFLNSTGCRIGVLPDLRMKHIADIENCKSVIIYQDSKEEYTTFLTPESSKALEEYFEERRKDGEIFEKESPVFRTTYQFGSQKSYPLGHDALQDVTDRIVKNAGLLREKSGKRYNIQKNHGFRKRFNTILKQVPDLNSNVAEKLLGHKNGLDGVYFVPTRDELFTEFKKAIPDLTIDQSEKLEVKLKEAQVEKNRLEEMERKLESNERLIRMLQETIPADVYYRLYPEQRPKIQV